MPNHTSDDEKEVIKVLIAKTNHFCIFELGFIDKPFDTVTYISIVESLLPLATKMSMPKINSEVTRLRSLLLRILIVG